MCETSFQLRSIVLVPKTACIEAFFLMVVSNERPGFESGWYRRTFCGSAVDIDDILSTDPVEIMDFPRADNPLT